MDIIIYLITAVLVICCILLTGVVLIQRPRSEGLGTAFGGGMTESMFGAGTSDILTKITIWMAGAFFVCTLLLAILMSHKQSAKPSVLESALIPDVPSEMPTPDIEQVDTTVEQVETPEPAATVTEPVESGETQDSASAPEKAE